MPRVLVAEDERKWLRALRASPAVVGYEVQTAATGAEAERLLAGPGFDAVVLDWTLLGRSGVEVLAGRRPAGRTIPVLLLTDREAVEDRDAGAVVTREMLGREVWRDPGCHLTNVIDLDREGTPMNGQHPLTRREALRAASAFGAGGAALALAGASAAQAGKLDADTIGRAAGVKATTAPDGVVRIAWARTDVAVAVDGMPLKPFAGLGSWAAFIAAPHGAMVMGDTVVFQDEVSPGMDAAFAHGLEVTALHNHFFYDEPKVYFMHVGGTGEPEKLAAGVKAVWDAIKKVRSENPRPAGRFPGESPKPGAVTAGPIEKIVGTKPDSQDGVVKVTIGREGTMHGVKVAGSMGLTTWAAFSGTDELAAVDGDFIMTAAEVQPVLRALRKAGIHVVALHNHMAGEQPAFYFTHFWGKGKAADLANGVKSALDAQKQAAAGKH